MEKIAVIYKNSDIQKNPLAINRGLLNKLKKFPE